MFVVVLFLVFVVCDSCCEVLFREFSRVFSRVFIVGYSCVELFGGFVDGRFICGLGEGFGFGFRCPDLAWLLFRVVLFLAFVVYGAPRMFSLIRGERISGHMN